MKGLIVEVLIDDHLIEHKKSTKGHTARFKIRGIIKAARGKYITIETWQPVPEDDHNAETAKVLKSTIVEMWILKKVKRLK
jgi:hypothetical protein